MFRKGLVIGVIILFVGASITPITISSKVNLVLTDDRASSVKCNNYLPNNQMEQSYSWWNNDWKYRRILSINHTFIDESLTNFPLLFVINSSIGAKCDNGDSIRFISIDNSFEYYYEIEDWNRSGGNSYVWVNITRVSNNEDTNFYIYYNNSKASDDQNPSDVWSSHYEAVFHMNNAIALHDSAGADGFQNSTTTSGSPVCNDGKIGPAIVFDGISDCYSLGDVLDLGLPNHPSGCDWAFSFWGKMPPHDYTYRAAYAKYWDEPLEQGMRFTFGADDGRDVYADVRQPLGIVTIDTAHEEETKWHFYAFYYDSANHMVYTDIDRTLYQASLSKDISNASNEENAFIGCDFLGNHRFYEGFMDEMRFTIGIPTTESWFDATYNNTNQTPEFLLYEAEEVLNFPPYKPTIDGLKVGKPGVQYEYKFTTTDPDDDQIYYYVDWGDTSVQDWFGPFDSGENATASHSWSQGHYEIRVKAKDTKGAESEWSDPYPITMPRDKATNNMMLLRFLERFAIL